MGAQWRREMQGLLAGCGGGGLDAYMVCWLQGRATYVGPEAAGPH